MNKKNNILEQYYKLLFPSQLENNEFIRIVAFKSNSSTKEQSLTKQFYVQTFQEFEKIVINYRYNWNLFVTSSTTRGNVSGSTEYMWHRKVLFFDFDKKDFPQFTEFKDFAMHFKINIPDLFFHAAIDSGNGYHFYCAIENSDDVERISEINKKLITIVGADERAGSVTQLMRIPTSFNLKNSEEKLVKVIVNTFGTDKYKPYTLAKLDTIIGRITKNQEFDSVKSSLHKNEYQGNEKQFYCVQKMINEGAEKGDRNFCLGRIINYCKISGYSQSKAKQLALNWNALCRPPKLDKEVTEDFERYWNTNYKLLGCNIESKTLAKFCDKTKCININHFNENTSKISISNRILTNQHLRKFTGNHFILLTVLNQFKEPISRNKIRSNLRSKDDGKMCFCDRTLDKILQDLINEKLIVKDDYGYIYKEPP